MTEHWRTGRKVGRTIYIHQGNDEKGRLIGLIDTPELATRICHAINTQAAHTDRRERVIRVLRDYLTLEPIEATGGTAYLTAPGLDEIADALLAELDRHP